MASTWVDAPGAPGMGSERFEDDGPSPDTLVSFRWTQLTTTRTPLGSSSLSTALAISCASPRGVCSLLAKTSVILANLESPATRPPPGWYDTWTSPKNGRRVRASVLKKVDASNANGLVAAV